MMTELKHYTGLTCISCRLVFDNPDFQREHYRSDWHRYNVKRQVASLPPISLEDYKEKEELFVEAQPSSSAAEALFCKACHKMFQSKNAYGNHQKSKKHVDNVVLLNLIESEAATVVPTKAQMRKDMPREVVEEVPDELMPEDESDDDSGSGSWHTTQSDDDDEEEEEDGVDFNDCAFLYLPSGARIGHRSLFRYFRQSLKPVDTLALQQGSTQSQMRFTTKRLKALGWTGATGQVAVRKAQDVKFLRRIASKYQLKNGLKQNKLFKTQGRKDQQ